MIPLNLQREQVHCYAAPKQNKAEPAKLHRALFTFHVSCFISEHKKKQTAFAQINLTPTRDKLHVTQVCAGVEKVQQNYT